MWTIDELVERVRGALAAEYPGAPNARVRDVPDRRAIRWYTTIGLVDKPLGMRGRTALYGPRHLRQLVAIKRRQADGRSLAQIQAEFSWFTSADLEDASRVPQYLLANDGRLTPDHSDRADRFWARSAEALLAEAAEPATPAPPAPPAEPAASRATTRPVSAVPLDGGVLLIVPQTVTDHDRDAIAAAAAPLLALLTSRGLTDGSSS